MDHHDVIVIGGGISGLAFAHQCAQDGRSVLVLERAAQIGGCVRSERLGSEFFFELGAHTAYATYQAMLGILERTHGLDRLLERRRAPYRLLVGGQLRSVVRELDLVEILRRLPRIFRARKEGRTVREFYAPLVGDANYARVLGPMFAAVPSQPADEFPADMLFKRRPRDPRAPRSFTMPGGLSTLLDEIAASPRVRVLTSMDVGSLEHRRGALSVLSPAGAFRAPLVALATPPAVAASLLGPGWPELAGALGRIASARVESVGVVVRRGSTRLPRMAGLVPVQDVFYSAVTRDVLPHPDLRAFTFHFRPGLAAEVKLARIAEVLGIARSGFEHVTHHASVLPSPRRDHAGVVAELDRRLAGEPVFLLGNYFRGLSLEDCVQRARDEHARLGASRLAN